MTRTKAIALLYRSYLRPDAATIVEHVSAFPRYSRFEVVAINTDLPYPSWLEEYEFQAVVIHYSFFTWQDPRYLRWLYEQRSAYKVAFFQDEYDHCQARFAFLDRFKFDCIFTLLEPDWHQAVYGARTSVKRIEWTLPGYVSDEVTAAASRYAKVDHERSIDIGYRARTLPYFMGRGAQEKHRIALEVRERAMGSDLVLDIDSSESSRLYGDAWHEFLGNCKGVLGVEAGTSTFDLDGSLKLRCEAYLAENPAASFDDLSAHILGPYEDKIFYRTISPRHFEAAAFGCVQILFRGRYSGILQPNVHYLPLEKDFSNFDHLIQEFSDPLRRAEIRTVARADLVDSGRYSYKRFVTEHFDQVLAEDGVHELDPRESVQELRERVRVLHEPRGHQGPKQNLLARLLGWAFPGRRTLVRVARAVGIVKRPQEVSLFTASDEWSDGRQPGL